MPVYQAPQFCAKMQVLTELQSINRCKYQEWKISIGGNIKEKTRLVEIEIPVADFRDLFMDEMSNLRDHVERVKVQHKAIKDLKEKLLPTQCLIQMDFAEDYRCQNNDEAQNAYFGAGNMTIFPTVNYYKEAVTPKQLVKILLSFQMKAVTILFPCMIS